MTTAEELASKHSALTLENRVALMKALDGEKINKTNYRIHLLRLCYSDCTFIETCDTP